MASHHEETDAWFKDDPYQSEIINAAMADLSRIGVAIDADLLDKFDEHIASRGYTNRSEAFRDLSVTN